jgi:hypothetical protein
MKIAVRTRKLNTPQTNHRTGEVLTDSGGEPVYTQYIKGASDQYKIRKHAHRYIKSIIEVFAEINLLSDSVEEVIPLVFGFDPAKKVQSGKDPFARTWWQRFEIVDSYLSGKNQHNDLTTGIVDDYNTVVKQMYANSGLTPVETERMLITLTDYQAGEYLQILNPSLFDS